MSNYYPYNKDQESLLQPLPVASKTFMSNVFLWMFGALTISAFAAILFSNSPALMQYLYNADGRQNLMGKAVMFMPLIFVLIMSFAYSRLNAIALGLLFIAYSIINGISFSYILSAYTSGSVISCFAGAAGMFGIMAIAGFTTKKDLTKMGSLLMMALIGMIVMSIVNWFMGSSMMNYIIGAIGVVVFTGLTAYDIQKLKNIGDGIDQNGNIIQGVDTRKYAILGALNLYLDFVNIFLSLLRITGSRN
jgi:uncharacterized protein